MHNFPLLFLCEKEKRQNTSDKYIKKLAKRLDMSDENGKQESQNVNCFSGMKP